MHHHRRVPLLLGALAATALAACGADDGRAGPAAGAAAPAPRAAGYLDRHALALGVGNSFRARLDQLAVLQQPPDGATDLGQDLPAGLLRDVACAPAAGQPAAGRAWPWRCRVRWETLRGTAKTTNYAVRSFATGCFAAGATPRLAPIKDPTIASFSEHPLNSLAGLGRGC